MSVHKHKAPRRRSCATHFILKIKKIKQWATAPCMQFHCSGILFMLANEYMFCFCPQAKSQGQLSLRELKTQKRETQKTSLSLLGF